MSFWDFIRNIFGTRNFGEPTSDGIFGHQNDVFINSVWQNDENNSNIRSFNGNGNHFNVFSDPLEITRFFESQIDHMLKNFMFGYNNEGHNAIMDTFPFTSPNKENLRDKMLKPNHDLNQPAVKVDTDLDGKITPDNFSNVWDKHDKPNSSEFGLFPHITGKSIVKEYMRGPNGIIKQKQVIRDHEGNEETIISQQAGEKMYTVVIKKDKNGVETKTENFVNTDKSELPDGKDLLLNNEPSFNNIDLNIFSWKNFFYPNPKL